MPKIFLSTVCFGVALLLAPSAQAFRKSQNCNKTELRLKSCALENKPYQIHFTHDKILIHDGVWRGIEALPLIGENTEWEKIQISQYERRFFAQLEIWDEPKGQMQVQTLQWIVLELKGTKLHEHFRKVLQKRQPMLAEGADVSVSKKFKFDKKVSYGLTKAKDHGKESLIWKYRQEQGELK